MEPELPRSQPPDLAAADLDVGWALLRTMVVLGMVVLLAWLTLNVGLRKLMGIRPAVGTQLITVLERVPLDQKRALFVVEAAGEVLLVGGGDAGLSLLAKLDKAEVDRLRAAGGEGGLKLSPLVQKLLGRKDVPPPPAA
jgi:flagellar protein FliO/FliZ